MPRLPIKLPPAAATAGYSRLRGLACCSLLFAAVFGAALLAMEIMLG